MPGALRDSILLVALATVTFGYERRQHAREIARGDAAPEARNVILVVSDGLRWQEVVRGADSSLVFGTAMAFGGDAASVRSRFWRPTAAQRREALMPFVWHTLARRGQILGNRDLASRVNVTNRMNFSYPGYNEMLVGYPDARIDRNDYGPNPNVTVFEWMNRRKELGGRVGAIGAWDTFHDIFNRARSNLPIHAGRVEPLDARAHMAAMRMLTELHPRALFVAYVETDDHAHHGRYDLTLQAAHEVDAYLGALWSAVQSSPQYRNRTTLIFTADHGRGRTQRDWMNHGPDVAGADESWIAMMGPGISPLGERGNAGAFTTAQVAATVAAALGLDYVKEIPGAASPIHSAMIRNR